MKRRYSWAAAAAYLAVVGACVVSEIPEESTDVATQAIGTGGPCPDAVCGENSPVINKIGFYDLHLFGIANTQGYAIETIKGIAQIVQGTNSYDLHVVDGVITGWKGPFLLLAGQGLVDSYIPIQRGKTHYKLLIKDVRPMTYFAPPLDPIEAYTFQYVQVGASDTPLPLCDNIDELIKEQTRDPEFAQADLMGMLVLESLVFEGDRVYETSRTMSKTADDSWFNIGCAGHTLAKLRLTRNTIHSQSSTLSRPWEQRQATLKMYSADYCGNGTVFTVAGQRMVWQGGGIGYHSGPHLLEARWNENGAQCLYAPRMLFPSTPDGPVYFPKILDQIHAVCIPMKCGNQDLAFFDAQDRMSADPY